MGSWYVSWDAEVGRVRWGNPFETEADAETCARLVIRLVGSRAWIRGMMTPEREVFLVEPSPGPRKEE